MTDVRVDSGKYRFLGAAAVLLFGVGHGVRDALAGEPILPALLPTLPMALQVVLLVLGSDLAERRNWSVRLRAGAAVGVSLLCGVLIKPLHQMGGPDWPVSFSLSLGVLVLWLMLSYFPMQVSLARARALAAESEQRKADLERLRSHLHPHFLLNSLNAVAGLLTADPRQARQLLIALGDLLRDALEDQDGLRPLADEVAWLRRYAEIFEIRHAGAIHFAWEISPDTTTVMLPRLLLQPLLENAIEHGALRRPGGSVKLSSQRRGDAIVIVVSDDGPGMPPESAAGKTGLGLRLVRDRLQLAHARATMTIDSSTAGTRVTLCLPFNEGAR
jgi:signal transduction histidine kinase